MAIVGTEYSLASLKRRLLVSYFLVSLAAVIVLVLIFSYGIKAHHLSKAEQELREQTLLAANLYSNLPLHATEQAKRQLLQEHVEAGQYALAEILNTEGTVLIQIGESLPRRVEAANDFQAALLGEVGTWRGQNYVKSERIQAVCVPIYQNSKIVNVLRFTASLEPAHQIVNTLVFYSLIVGMIALFVSPSVFRPLTKQAVAPLESLTDAAERLITSKYPSRLVVPPEEEFGKVAKVYNAMFDQIERTDQVQNEFISSVSHELRTPLTAIKGWGETLRSGNLEDKDEIMLGLDIIDKEALRMIGLVEDLLDFSHLQAGRISLNLEKVSINQLVSEVHDVLSIKAARKSVALAMELGGGLREMEADGDRLKQVLLNLLDNSLKFTPMGGSITIRTYRYGEAVEIDVIDTGPGIAAKDLPNILSRFVKVDGRAPGSGLGLAIANDIVTLHGGKLLITSDVGKGTKATVRLPLGGVHHAGR